MTIRILIIFLPCLIGMLWHDTPGLSISWSLGGSVFIAAIAQTKWFGQSNENQPFTRRLLRPVSMYSFLLAGVNVFGGGAYALNAAGHTLWGASLVPVTASLPLVSECLRLMLLAHASVTAGMKLVGFSYDKPKYTIP